MVWYQAWYEWPFKIQTSKKLFNSKFEKRQYRKGKKDYLRKAHITAIASES